jgi:superfamily II DNA or RNA helicase/HKD family nuclease
MDDLILSFNTSLQTGYVDKSISSNLEYQPELLVNQKNPPKKVLSTILHELENCNQFFISVAFVTTCGVATIINKLKELENREIKGKILVSQYLNFTQPEALKRLLQFNNIELRIAKIGNAHTKGYIFKSKKHYNLIVGSSNLTAQALSTNKEWNIKVSALDESGIVEKVLREFHLDFEIGTPVTSEYIFSYEKIYNSQFLLNHKSNFEGFTESQLQISPNSMQKEALKNLQNLRAEGKNKALIISATGTGKTYLSAFDAKSFNPERLLFVVHRLTIAKDALNTFKNVFGATKTMGLYSGSQRELDCDFVFSTIQTISKSNHLENFSRSHFDYIIIDETHRSGAESYLSFLEYFQPRFLLGMTATPERTDGNDIFKLFDHNIAYEIRLSRAMQENMLSEFHYYGVTDLFVDNNKIDNKTDFGYLVTGERVDRIIEQAIFYGTDNGITRGLIFCSRKEEAKELSILFNKRGFKTVALTGDSSEEERAMSIKNLETDNLRQKLDYIFTVDIFNEGIDIPKINQIIMLRPTESVIVFIQQLGRGLRKVDGKGYLTVIDFIGNYENNYLIPVALYGDISYNKDSIRKLISEGSRMIPGSSTINFDEITKERIFKSIDSANMQLFTDLKKDYSLLKFKLGRTPMMMDFIEHGSRDPFLFVDYANSYYNFILKVDKIENSELSKEEVKILELFSKEINNSKRIEESLILNLLIESGELSVEELKNLVLQKYHYLISDATIQSCVSNLNFEFIREKKSGKLIPVKEIYNLEIIKLQNGFFSFSKAFIIHLKRREFRHFLLDSVKYSIHEFDRLFETDKWQDGFVLYRKYSRKDVFRILNVPENPVAQNVGGYLLSQDNEHCPIFVNYHKEEHISESTKYEDEFVDNQQFDWMSKSNRTLSSNDVKSILGHNGPIRLPLFIKKNNDEGLEFYYMGEVTPQLNHVSQTTIPNDNGKPLSVVKIRFSLTNPVANSIYNYLHEKSILKVVKQEETSNIIPFYKTLGFEKELRNPIPLYDFYAAAGTFSDLQSDKDFTLIEGPENSSGKDYFACRIVGESMNRVIPNGSICMFKQYTGGSKNGKIVLVENRDIQDPDFNSAFTIKTYTSEKSISEESWVHESIVLRPNSFDNTYQNIIISEENAAEMRVVGEFVKILYDYK